LTLADNAIVDGAGSDSAERLLGAGPTCPKTTIFAVSARIRRSSSGEACFT
jgi:hypothetical protein